jgi:chromate transporter
MLLRLFKASILLGITAFGGPAAHIALVQREWVERKKWISTPFFLQMIALSTLIPGPNSTELIMHIGYHKKGIKGLLVVSIGFIVPAALITILLTHLYQRLTVLTITEAALDGIALSIIALIITAIIKLNKTLVKGRRDIVWVLLSMALAYMGTSEIIIMGSVVILYFGIKKWGRPMMKRAVFSGIETVSLSVFVLNIAKIGCVLFGSGYVLIAYLEDAFIEHLQWITYQQLLDGVAIGQLTPGPLLTTVTALGYMLFGWSGGILGTVALFLPAGVFVIATHRILIKNTPEWLKKSMHVLNASVIGIIINLCFQLTQSLEWSFATVLLVLVYIGLFAKSSIPSPIIIGMSGVIGVCLLYD